MRWVYSVSASVLSLAIILMLITLWAAQDCGLQFGFLQGLLAFSLLFFWVPFIAIPAAFVFTWRLGRRILVIEVVIAVTCALLLFVYGSQPHQGILNDDYRYAHCQISGP